MFAESILYLNVCHFQNRVSEKNEHVEKSDGFDLTPIVESKSIVELGCLAVIEIQDHRTTTDRLVQSGL